MMTTHTLQPDIVAHNITRTRPDARAMALNLADWHRSSVQHFGLESHYTDSLWWRPPGGSGIYLGALIHEAQWPDEETFAELQAVEALWGEQGFEVYDCLGTHDLSRIGFKQVVKNPWYLRLPAPAPELALPEGLSIEIATTPQQLADFERASWEGFEEPENPEEAFRGREPFSQHPAGTLTDEGMYYLNARLNGEVLAGVIIHATEDMLGVYGISTLIPYRRRGYGSALIRAALALHPDLPTSVFPDPVSLPLYSVVGFEAAGKIAIWKSSKAD